LKALIAPAGVYTGTVAIAPSRTYRLAIGTHMCRFTGWDVHDTMPTYAIAMGEVGVFADETQ